MQLGSIIGYTVMASMAKKMAWVGSLSCLNLVSGWIINGQHYIIYKLPQSSQSNDPLKVATF